MRLARQAAAGLSHVRRPSRRDAGAYVGLGEPGGDQRELGPALGGGTLPRPMVAEVVDVHAEHDHGRLGVGDRCEHVHQLGLAVVAAVEVVEAVGGPGHLVRVDGRPAQPPLVGQAAAVLALVAGQRRRDGGDGVRPSFAERPLGDSSEERRVSPAAEGDHDPVELAQLGLQGGDLGVERGVEQGVEHNGSVPRLIHRATGETSAGSRVARIDRRSATATTPAAASTTSAGSAGARMRWAP